MKGATFFIKFPMHYTKKVKIWNSWNSSQMQQPRTELIFQTGCTMKFSIKHLYDFPQFQSVFPADFVV